jgi:hypothetical protein
VFQLQEYSRGVGIRRAAIAILAITVAGAALAPTRSSASSVPSGLVTLSGRIGAVQLNVSSTAAIEAAVGQPEIQTSGVFDPGLAPYLALGYECSGPDISQCATAYYVNEATGRLESFATTSSAYHLPSSARVGMSGTRASRLTHHRDIGGCLQGISLTSHVLTMYLATRGGRMHVTPGGPLVVSGGRVISIAVEDRKHGVGVLFC